MTINNLAIKPSSYLVSRSIGMALSAISHYLPGVSVVKNVHLEQYIARECSGDESLHIVDLKRIVNRCLLWQQHFPNIHPFFSVKTNHDPVVITTLASLGIGFDCSTSKEVDQVIALGASPDRIIFANPRKPQSAISSIFNHRIRMIVVDSQEEIKKTASKVAPHSPKMLLRILTDDHLSGTPLSTKFGVSLQEGKETIDFAFSHGFPIDGISFHVGSNSLDANAYTKAIRDSAQLFEYTSLKWKRKMTVLDIGGGWPGNQNDVYAAMAARVNKAIIHHFRHPIEVIAEPGRFLCMDSTTLVSKILGKRTKFDDKVGKKIEYFINNGVYGFFLSSIYFGHNLRKSLAEGWKFSCLKENRHTFPTKLWGPTLDSGDMVVDGIRLPELNEGDLILTSNIGSYGRVYQSDFSQMPPSKPHYIISEEKIL